MKKNTKLTVGLLLASLATISVSQIAKTKKQRQQILFSYQKNTQ
jgi:hypothetical protein